MFLLVQSTHRMVVQYDPLIGHRYVPDLTARIPSETLEPACNSALIWTSD